MWLEELHGTGHAGERRESLFLQVCDVNGYESQFDNGLLLHPGGGRDAGRRHCAVGAAPHRRQLRIYRDKHWWPGGHGLVQLCVFGRDQRVYSGTRIRTAGRRASTAVSVSYNGTTVGSGTATLTATYNEYPSTTDNGSVNVTVTANPVYGVSVVPVNPSQSVTVGTARIPLNVTNTSQDVSAQ